MWKEFIIILGFLCLINAVHSEAIENTQVICSIDITTYIVKSKYKITFKNVKNSPIKQYIFNLVDGSAFATFENLKNETLSYDYKTKKNSTMYIVNLNQPILPEEEHVLKVKLIYPSKLVPATKFSRYDEQHSFVWTGNSLFYSTYYTKSYRFMFVTDPSFNNNLQMSIMYDSSVKNMYIYYSRNIPPFQYREISLTFTSPIPVFRVEKLSRSIFVSQFGLIQVEDQVSVVNAGPKLLGPYFNTQSDYWMFTHLPKTSKNIKFFDVLGNNSKTSVFEDETQKVLKFIPRYSLRQGGWKSSYILQYDVPIYEYVFNDGADYHLKIRALDHILNDVMIKDAEVKIVLPDGATILSVIVPPRFQKQDDTSFYTSLSVLGRRTVNLKGEMLLENHINDVIIKYHYSLFNFLSAPFFLICLIESVFFAIILCRKYSGKL